MKGQVIDSGDIENIAVINGDDGERYYFPISEWKSHAKLQRGMQVDFDSNGKDAYAVYAESDFSKPSQ